MPDGGEAEEQQTAPAAARLGLEDAGGALVRGFMQFQHQRATSQTLCLAAQPPPQNPLAGGPLPTWDGGKKARLRLRMLDDKRSDLTLGSTFGDRARGARVATGSARASPGFLAKTVYETESGPSGASNTDARPACRLMRRHRAGENRGK